MDLSGSQAATRSASGGGTLENGASADAGVTQEINEGQRSSSGAMMAVITMEEIDPETGTVTSINVSGTMIIARSFAWNAQVTSLISSLGTELRALAVLGGRYATGIVGGLLIPDNMFGEDFGCHSSMVTCVIDGKVVDASTGLPYEGGMVSSGGGADPNDPNGGDDDGYITVGRWMSQSEYEAMRSSGRVQQGGGGQTFVSTSGPSSFGSQAARGSVYAEFQVSRSSLLQGGRSDWFKTIGPNAAKSQQFMLQKQGGEMLPAFRNLSPVLKVK